LVVRVTLEGRIDKILRFLHIAEDAGRIATIVAMTILVFIQVMARIFFKWSSPAMEEAARFIMVWSIFIGAVVTTREDSHIRMGGIFHGQKGQLWFELFVKAVALFFLCVFVSWSYDFVLHSIRRGMNSIVLRVPMVVVHSCFLVTGILMVFHTLVHFIRQMEKVIGFYRGSKK